MDRWRKKGGRGIERRGGRLRLNCRRPSTLPLQAVGAHEKGVRGAIPKACAAKIDRGEGKCRCLTRHGVADFGVPRRVKRRRSDSAVNKTIGLGTGENAGEFQPFDGWSRKEDKNKTKKPGGENSEVRQTLETHSPRAAR